MCFSVDIPRFIYPLSHSVSLYKLLLEGLFFILVGEYPSVVGLLVAMVILQFMCCGTATVSYIRAIIFHYYQDSRVSSVHRKLLVRHYSLCGVASPCGVICVSLMPSHINLLPGVLPH